MMAFYFGPFVFSIACLLGFLGIVTGVTDLYWAAGIWWGGNLILAAALDKDAWKPYDGQAPDQEAPRD